MHAGVVQAQLCVKHAQHSRHLPRATTVVAIIATIIQTWRTFHVPYSMKGHLSWFFFLVCFLLLFFFVDRVEFVLILVGFVLI